MNGRENSFFKFHIVDSPTDSRVHHSMLNKQTKSIDKTEKKKLSLSWGTKENPGDWGILPAQPRKARYFHHSLLKTKRF